MIQPARIRFLNAKDPRKRDFVLYREELIVRRELSLNFVRYNEHYDGPEGIPACAQKTLAAHEGDPRPWGYTLGGLESARTHDPYWNAAQLEMVITGKMHGYMRMYWGKKIIEWSPGEDEASLSQ